MGNGAGRHAVGGNYAGNDDPSARPGGDERHGFGDNVCGTLAWASTNTPAEDGDWVGCAQALRDHGLPPATPDPEGSDGVCIDGRVLGFSDAVADCLLQAAPAWS